MATGKVFQISKMSFGFHFAFSKNPSFGELAFTPQITYKWNRLTAEEAKNNTDPTDYGYYSFVIGWIFFYFQFKKDLT